MTTHALRGRRLWGLSLLALAACLILALTSPAARSQSVVATIPVSNIGPLVVNPTTNTLYVSGSISTTVIDGASNSVIGTLPVGGQAVDLNPTTNRLYFIAQSGTALTVADATSGATLATVPVAGGFVAVNPTTNQIYVAGTYPSTTVTVVDGKSNTVVASVNAGGPPTGVAVNPTTNRIYVPTELQTLAIIDGGSNTVLNTIALGPAAGGGTAVAVNPMTNRIYVTDTCGLSQCTASQPTWMSVIDGASNAVIAGVPVGVQTWSVAVNPSLNHVYVASFRSDTVAVIDGASNSVLATLGSCCTPAFLAANPATNRVYAANTYRVDGAPIPPPTSVTVIADDAGSSTPTPSPSPTPTASPSPTATASVTSGGTIALRQSKLTVGTSASLTVGYASSVTAHDLLIASVVAFSNNGSTTTAVSDSVNGAWSKAVSNNQGPDAVDVSLWYVLNTGAGTPTVTVSAPGATHIVLTLMEYAAVGTRLDVVAANHQSNIKALTTGAVTTKATDLLVTVWGDSGYSTTLTAGSGWTLVQKHDNNATIQAATIDAGDGTGGLPAGSYAGTLSASAGTSGSAVLASFGR
jgi:YVTN family beta-propeller protein